MGRARRWLRWVQPLGGAIVVVALWYRVGPGPVVDALGRIDGWTLVAVSGIALVTTACTSWRWVLVARGLGLDLSLRKAVSASYRAQFLNVSLPSGVVGDVHRGLSHGRDTGDLGRGLRSVVWERSAGQAVQVCLAAVALLVVPSSVRAPLLAAPALLVTATIAVLLALMLLATRRSRSRVADRLHAVTTDLRQAVLSRRTWPGVVGSSILAVVGHVATFLIAARTAGIVASPLRLVPLAFVVLLAMALPVNLAGWGPREGAAAWAFGAAGLGAGQGFATAVVYGGLVLVASLPGAVILTVSSVRRASRDRRVRGDIHA
jgi:uncharacterized membrane protein YbhN (UPF0104 family)